MSRAFPDQLHLLQGILQRVQGYGNIAFRFSRANKSRAVRASSDAQIRSFSRWTSVSFQGVPQRGWSANERKPSGSQCVRRSWTVSRCRPCCVAMAFARHPSPKYSTVCDDDASASRNPWPPPRPILPDPLPATPEPSASSRSQPSFPCQTASYYGKIFWEGLKNRFRRACFFFVAYSSSEKLACLVISPIRCLSSSIFSSCHHQHFKKQNKSAFP